MKSNSVYKKYYLVNTVQISVSSKLFSIKNIVHWAWDLIFLSVVSHIIGWKNLGKSWSCSIESFVKVLNLIKPKSFANHNQQIIRIQSIYSLKEFFTHQTNGTKKGHLCNALATHNWSNKH